MSESQLTVLPPQQIIDVAKHALSIDAIVAQRDLIKSCMAKAMEEGQHYGRVPGCGDKPTLLQPGAQLLAHLFRLRPEYEIIETDLLHDHKRFRVTCRLYVMGSTPPISISEGVGESSSMESKHRFRNAAKQVRFTEDPVPHVYWNLHKEDKADGGHRAKDWLRNSYGSDNYGAKKNERGEWLFVEYLGGNEDKVENTNPADVFNTVLKIAKKRAFVDATITATASSDFFTQDLEDIRENVEATKKEEKPVNGSEVRSSAAPAQAAGGNGDLKGWRDVECTFGKKNGPLRGKKLGDLNESNLKYLCEMFLVEGKKIAAKDQKLVAGLAMWKASQSQPAPKGKAAAAEKYNGPNHSKLAELLAWENPEIAQEDFLEAMKEQKQIPADAKSFMGMSDETAKVFLDNYDDAKQVVRVYLAKKETPAS